MVSIVPKTSTYEKMRSNIQEVKARGGRLILVATDGDETAKDVAEDVIYVPAVSDELSPLVTVIPLQIMSYYIALKLGCDVDQPRNYEECYCRVGRFIHAKQRAYYFNGFMGTGKSVVGQLVAHN